MESFEDLFNASSGKKQKKLRPGDRVEATVAGVGGENVFLDVGGKSEGFIDAAELRDEEGNLRVKPGDRLHVHLLSDRGGELRFTTRIGAAAASAKELADAFANEIPVEGVVKGEVKGGFEVTVAGTRAFCPYSQLDVRRIEDPESYVGQRLTFKIIEYGNDGRNVVLSARVLIEEERERRREELRQSLHPGDTVRGTVSSLRDFGAFVDLGGIDGLIPISELSWGQVASAAEVLSLGQEVEVAIKELDWERNRVSLSLRATKDDPWDKAEQRYSPGSVHMGQVARLMQFGAFVTLEPGIDGLLHVSRLGGGRRINHPREAVEEGQEISVRIESLDRDKRRIALVPDDYVRAEEEERERVAEHRREEAPRSMGTFGDLLRKGMKGK